MKNSSALLLDFAFIFVFFPAWTVILPRKKNLGSNMKGEMWDSRDEFIYPTHLKWIVRDLMNITSNSIQRFYWTIKHYIAELSVHA